jgi:hypothetical protein
VQRRRWRRSRDVVPELILSLKTSLEVLHSCQLETPRDEPVSCHTTVFRDCSFGNGYDTNTWDRYLSRYSGWLRAGRHGDRIPVGSRFYAPVQTDPGTHPSSCIMGTGSFPGVESSRGVTLTPHPLLMPRSKNRVVLYLYSP